MVTWTKRSSEDSLFYPIAIFDIRAFDRCVFGATSPLQAEFWTKVSNASTTWS